MEDNQKTTIHVFAGTSLDGKPVQEELPARRISENQFELLASPGLALNIAKGDIIEVRSAKEPAKLIKRGGNFCVQIYADLLSEKSSAEIERLFKSSLPGTIDGGTKKNLAFSIPGSAGFEEVEDFFDSITDKYHCEWYFGNVYMEDGITPLNWWLKK